MKGYIFYIFFLATFLSFGQNIQVDSQTYSPQQLIEDILIDSNCISNITVTNVVGGDFNGNDQSYGYFDASGTTFPFQTGIVLSTGRLSNVDGPNTTLSDDDAPNWVGDNDLEVSLNETNTLNATILEFDFTSIGDEISFRYIFASEEYQEGNPNTCQFSDLFGFLIRPIGSTNYTNIALIPNTTTPVKVTTVHPGIPGACQPQNEFYFDDWNDAIAPINFNGQTKVLTAIAQTIPNQTYHVKLVIADEQNFRFDSAVFLEAGSFQLSTNLGPDRLLSNNNPICEDETLTLNAFQTGATGYRWSKDGIPETATFCPNCFDYNVTEAGTYSVEVQLANGCSADGEIIIEYIEKPLISNTVLIACDENQDGITTYNLFDAETNITNNDSSLFVTDFYTNQTDAEQENNPISNSTSYENMLPMEIVFARVENQWRCYSVAEVVLDISNNTVNTNPIFECDNSPTDGFTIFDLNDVRAQLQNQIPTGSNVSFYETLNDVFSNTNILDDNYTNTTVNTQTIYLKIESASGCFAISSVELNIIYTPELLPDESFIYCLNNFPETTTLVGGVLNDSPSNYYYQWLFNGQNTSVNTSFIEANEIGTYTVIVTDPNGCAATRDIILTPSNSPTINSIDATELSSNNTVTVNTSGEGSYEYAIDNSNGPYQQSNIFNNVDLGTHTVYVRDINGCGTTSETLSITVFSIPNYFTPNGDSVNELWNPFSSQPQLENNAIVYIFNRYGKLITSLTPTSRGWNGTYKGQTLPSDDYWYTIKTSDGKTFQGHFSLIR